MLEVHQAPKTAAIGILGLIPGFRHVIISLELMKKLKLSLVIPAYNEEAYIDNCLAAIAAQSEKPDEVIVVDNNSTDKTVEIAQKYLFVRVISEQQQGLFYSRNRGMNEATGDILGRIDADTLLGKNWVKNVKQLFSKDYVHAATGPLSYHDMPLEPLGFLLDDSSRRIARLGGYQFIAGANMAISKNAWDKVKSSLCNEPFLFEDIDIVQHLKEVGIEPVYAPGMKASMSARRYADKPQDFVKYIGGHSRTHRFHNQPVPVGARWAEGMFSLGYIVLKPLHLTYDPALKRPSLAYALKRGKARPDPMTAK
jgi:glycosyltransferase involved in cell wall biosynthesis